MFMLIFVAPMTYSLGNNEELRLLSLIKRQQEEILKEIKELKRKLIQDSDAEERPEKRNTSSRVRSYLSEGSYEGEDRIDGQEAIQAERLYGEMSGSMGNNRHYNDLEPNAEYVFEMVRKMVAERNFDEAIGMLLQCAMQLEQKPQDPDTVLARVDCACELGDAYHKASELKKAVESLQDARKMLLGLLYKTYIHKIGIRQRDDHAPVWSENELFKVLNERYTKDPLIIKYLELLVEVLFRIGMVYSDSIITASGGHKKALNVQEACKMFNVILNAPRGISQTVDRLQIRARSYLRKFGISLKRS